MSVHLYTAGENRFVLCLPCFGLFSSFHAIFGARRSHPMIRPCTVVYTIMCCEPAQMTDKNTYWQQSTEKSTINAMH